MLTALIILVSFHHLGAWIFGSRTMASNDGDIQYLDFYNYLRELLQGNESWTYSWHKGLGGGTIGIIAYYLISPFHLLIFAFPPEHITHAYDLIFICELAMCAVCASIYISYRSNDRIDPFTNVLLSVGYGVMPFSLFDAKIIWYDAACILPLMAIAVVRYLRTGRVVLVAVMTAVVMILTWYGGAMNLVFLAIYILFEVALSRWSGVTGDDRPRAVSGGGKTEAFATAGNRHAPGNDVVAENSDAEGNRRHSIGHAVDDAAAASPYRAAVRASVIDLLKLGGAMLLGLGISMVVFLPNYFAMKQGRGSISDLPYLVPSIQGNVLNIFSSYIVGRVPELYQPALFVGSLALVAPIVALCAKKISWFRRYALAAFLVIITLCFFVDSFIAVFSLFKKVESYWYRYGYVGSFALIVAATVSLSDLSELRARAAASGGVRRGVLRAVVPVLAVGCYAIMANYMDPYLRGPATISFVGLVAALIWVGVEPTKRKTQGSDQQSRHSVNRPARGLMLQSMGRHWIVASRALLVLVRPLLPVPLVLELRQQRAVRARAWRYALRRG